MKVVHDVREMVMTEVKEHELSLPDKPENARDFIDAYIFKIRETTDESSSFYKDAGSNKSIISFIQVLYSLIDNI